MATIYLIICHDSSNDELEEVTSAHTSRKIAEERRGNLNKNFPGYKFSIKPIELQGVVVSRMENNCYIFGINE